MDAQKETQSHISQWLGSVIYGSEWWPDKTWTIVASNRTVLPYVGESSTRRCRNTCFCRSCVSKSRETVQAILEISISLNTFHEETLLTQEWRPLWFVFAQVYRKSTFFVSASLLQLPESDPWGGVREGSGLPLYQYPVTSTTSIQWLVLTSIDQWL